MKLFYPTKMTHYRQRKKLVWPIEKSIGLLMETVIRYYIEVLVELVNGWSLQKLTNITKQKSKFLAKYEFAHVELKSLIYVKFNPKIKVETQIVEIVL